MIPTIWTFARPSLPALRGATTLLALTLLASLMPAGVAAADEPPLIAADSFARTVSGGWGTADLGGTYTYDGGLASFSVNGSAAQMTLPKAGASRGAFLADGAARDTDSLLRIEIPARPAGGGLWVYAVARRSAGNEYRPKLSIGQNGVISVHAGAFVNGAESPVAPVRPAGTTLPSTGGAVWLRSLVTGANPTTISVKAWLDGNPEPAAWQFQGMSSTAALQGAGTPGLRAYVSSITNAPYSVRFDELQVRSLDAPPPPDANFRWTRQDGGLRVDFQDESLNGVDTWLWDFGDGTTSTEQHPSHEYAAEDTYTVSLTVSGPTGTDDAMQQVIVRLPPPPPGPGTIAEDDFTRAGATWAAATKGGLYSYQGTVGNFSVDGQRGVMNLPAAGASRSAFLFSPLVLDGDMTFSVSTNKAAAGASIYVYGVMRRATDGATYRAKLRLAPNGAVFVHASRFVNNSESSLGPEVRVDGLAHSADAVIRVRAEIAGSNPTTLRVRAWADGSPEPSDWQFSATDSTPRLQSAGALGLLSHIASGTSNAPVAVRFDDLLVSSDTPVARVQGPTFVGAADIALCTSQGDEATARLLDMIDGTVFTAGDNSQADGSAAEFANCYDPTWGRHKARTYPALGNHEYHATSDASPYFDYFGAVAGERGKGWYAYDVGTWRIYVLNSNCSFVSCVAGSVQEQWLRADLAANPRTCTIGIWHHPRYSSGSAHGSSAAVQPLWQALYDHGAEIVLSGHDHHYERFARMNASGAADPANGIRQIIVGTGGIALRSLLPSPLPTTEVRQNTANGVLRLVLGDGEYEWEFIPIAGQTFTDRGSESCH